MAKKLGDGIPAPNFELVDTRGETVSLAQYKGKRVVVLAALRGFT
jgi:peroxiredoxin